MKLLISHTAKIFLFILLINAAVKGQEKNTDSVFIMHKSPWGAVLRSAVIPGWGQIYNESYLKAPIIWGISAWLLFNWNENNKQYKDYKKLAIRNPRYISQRDFYHDQRDLFAIYMGLTYILNLVDAYVDAHLFDFNVGDSSDKQSFVLRMKINF